MIVYFEIRGRGKRPASRPCLYEDCYNCPLQRCREYADGVVRAECPSVEALRDVVRKNPRTLKILKVIKE